MTIMLHKLIADIHNFLHTSNITIVNADQDPRQHKNYAAFCMGLAKLKSKVLTMQTQTGVYYFHMTSIIDERPFFYQNLLTPQQIADYLKEDVNLVTQTKLATGEGLAKLAYFKALALSHDNSVQIDMVLCKYWSHTLLRFQLQGSTVYYDPWAALQIARFHIKSLVITQENLAQHLENVIKVTQKSVYNHAKIVATTHFFDIPSRELVPNRQRDYLSLQELFGHNFRNETGIRIHIKDPILAFSLFGKHPRQATKTGIVIASIEVALFCIYKFFFAASDKVKSPTITPLLVTIGITLLLSAAIGRYNFNNRVVDEGLRTKLVPR